MKMTESQKVAAAAWRIRRYALQMGEVQGQGYIGQALGYADVLATAFSHAMRYRPEDPQWEGRDRFLLSHGHYAIAYYAALLEAGIIPEEELETYGSDDSRLPMSGMATYTPGMEMSGGSLGQGLSIAVGMALGLRIQVRDMCGPSSDRRAGANAAGPRLMRASSVFTLSADPGPRGDGTPRAWRYPTRDCRRGVRLSSRRQPGAV